MLLFPHRIGRSRVHGIGLFTMVTLPAGTMLWCYDPGLDDRRPLAGLEPKKRLELLHYGYVNADRQDWVVICGDGARYWNFPPPGQEPNACLGQQIDAGESVVVAARAIAAGEELLIEAASDADYSRKMGLLHCSRLIR